jgi:hypothetical protein
MGGNLKSNKGKAGKKKKSKSPMSPNDRNALNERLFKEENLDLELDSFSLFLDEDEKRAQAKRVRE